jgi:DNA-binding response OmpR family regulator
MNKLLVVEDEIFTSDLLRRYFEIVGYEVVSALTGGDGFRMAVEQQPRVIILDIMLPDMDGYEVCRKLRGDTHTKNIPIIFLTQKDERHSRLDGLELGADDYITKPFDVEELRLRVHNILDRSGGTPLVDARTSLPNMALIKERLPRLIQDPNSVFLDVEVQHFRAFEKQYGPVAANQVVRTTARVIGDLLHEIDPARSFIGHPRDDHFLLAVPRETIRRVEQELPERFSKQIVRFYDYPDQQRGKMKVGEELVPFMAIRLMRIRADALRALVLAGVRPPARSPSDKPARDEAVAAPAAAQAGGDKPAGGPAQAPPPAPPGSSQPPPARDQPDGASGPGAPGTPSPSS